MRSAFALLSFVLLAAADSSSVGGGVTALVGAPGTPLCSLDVTSYFAIGTVQVDDTKRSLESVSVEAQEGA